MLTSLFFKGCLIGFSIAMPVGPIGLLCIRNSLARGLTYGLIAGLGAACADAIFGLIAALSLSAISTFLLNNQTLFHIFGAIFLIFLGLVTFKSKPSEECSSQLKENLFKVFISTFFLTLVNPLTILCFVGIFAGISLDFSFHWSSPLLVVLGVFFGSCLWWLILCSGASCFREKLTIRAKKWLNRISGLLLLCFSLVAIFAAIKSSSSLSDINISLLR